MWSRLSSWRKIAATLLCTMALLPAARAAELRFADQGPRWTNSVRNQFYTRDQGSRLIPLPWLLALQRPDVTRFLADGLQRYGYLRNPASNPGLPVGFTTGNWQGVCYIGMTCAACHTRQI